MTPNGHQRSVVWVRQIEYDDEGTRHRRQPAHHHVQRQGLLPPRAGSEPVHQHRKIGATTITDLRPTMTQIVPHPGGSMLSPWACWRLGRPGWLTVSPAFRAPEGPWCRC